MTDKEFRRLRKHDLLKLLVTQGKENIQLETQLEETGSQLSAEQEVNERLKAKLDEKDALIEKLKGRLDQKDARIKKLREDMDAWKNSRRIQLAEAGSIAEAALRLNGIFETAQQAADQYLYNLRIQCGLEEDEFPLESDDQDSGENERGKIQTESESKADTEMEFEPISELTCREHDKTEE